jgi:hypothetical protein
MPEILSPDQAAAEVGALAPRKRYSPLYESRMDWAVDLFDRAASGSGKAMDELKEAISTSDFPALFGSALDRSLMETYQQLTPIWTSFAARTTLADFRPKTLVDLLGGRGILERVGELDPYPQRKPSTASYTLQAYKYGGGFSLSWESIINDDLNSLAQMPTRLAQGAADTEDYVATQLLTDGNGPNDTFFNATAVGGTTSNLLTGNPALTTTSLSDALTAITSRRDSEGRPIAINGFVLVVPPALEVTARNILGATEIRTVVGSQTVIVGNWLSGRVTLVVNPWLPVIDTGSNAATTWYVVPAPISARPSLVLGFLRGHETPDLRQKADAGQRPGGGAVPAEEGSFDVDDVRYRIRHVLGSTGVDMIGSAASNGSGS